MLLRFLFASFVALGALGCTSIPPRLAHPQTELPVVDAKSDHVTVVVFFATWCPASRDMLAVAQDVWARDRAFGVRVVAVHEDEQPDTVDRFLSENHVGFAVASDHESGFARALGIRTIPALVVIDANGTVRRVVNGYHGDNDKRAAEGAVANLVFEMNEAAERRRDSLRRSIEAGATPNPEEPAPEGDDDKSDPPAESM